MQLTIQAGYGSAPTITITGNGSSASATATISGGEVVKVIPAEDFLIFTLRILVRDTDMQPYQ